MRLQFHLWYNASVTANNGELDFIVGEGIGELFGKCPLNSNAERRSILPICVRNCSHGNHQNGVLRMVAFGTIPLPQQTFLRKDCRQLIASGCVPWSGLRLHKSKGDNSEVASLCPN